MILALDQGTSSSRAFVFDRQARIRGKAQREFKQHFPQAGWVEHNPLDIWNTQLQTAREALEAAGIAGREIAAIGIANQRETILAWDRRTGKPLTAAIVWQDRRTAEFCRALIARGSQAMVAERTGLRIDPYFSATKIAWLLEHVPGLRERAERGEAAFGTVDSWLIRQLTGESRHVTDVTNASRTLLFNIHDLCWDEALLDLFGVPRAALADVLACTADFGAADSKWFGSAIPIAGVAGDQQAALAGHAAFDSGLAKNTYGTGAFAMLNTGDRAVRSEYGLLCTPAYQLAGHKPVYALEGSVFTTGAAVQWLRDGLQIIERAEQVESLARSVPDSNGVCVVPAFAGLGAPHWDPDARGTILGITRGTTRAHIARAVLEAIALSCADAIEAMQREAALTLTELRVDGGGSANDLLMQLQADLLNVPLARPQSIETTALGAAFFAGLQCGLWSSPQAISEHHRIERRFEPAMDAAARHASRETWNRAVERSRGWAAPQ